MLIMPHLWSPVSHFVTIHVDMTHILWLSWCVAALSAIRLVIIAVTLDSRRRHERAEGERLEGGCAARQQDAASASGGGDRRGLRLGGVLRRPRRGAGEVRDAAPGERGGHERELGRGGVRVLAAVLLPGGGRASDRRTAGVGAGQAGPPWRAQAHRGGPRPHPVVAGRRRGAAAGSAGGVGAGAVRAAGASPVDRTCARAGRRGRPEPEKSLTAPPSGISAPIRGGWRRATNGCVHRCWPVAPTAGGWAGVCWPPRGWPPGCARGPPRAPVPAPAARQQRKRRPRPCPPRPRQCPSPARKEVRIPRPAVRSCLPPPPTSSRCWRRSPCP